MRQVQLLGPACPQGALFHGGGREALAAEVKVCANCCREWGYQARLPPKKGVFEQGFGGCVGVFAGTLGEALTASSVMIVPLAPTHCRLGP